MPAPNVFKQLDKGMPNGFNVIVQNKNVVIGVSRMQGKWPFTEYSFHGQDEVLLVLKGKVEVEYSNGQRTVLRAGDVEIMPGTLGHKVHNAQKKPSDTLLIFYG
ncbi:MAG: cupin domain-containing protein [Candidatus Diapherotrites archaeon]|nr:cupin domain-containing protein [Candidatus Diapherotrites archaeon]